MGKGFYVGIIILTIFLFSYVAQAGTDTPYNIYGKATYEDGTPADGATVKIYPQDNPNNFITTIVGPEGNYGLSGWWKEDLYNVPGALGDGDIIVIEIDDGIGATGSTTITIDLSVGGKQVPDIILTEVDTTPPTSTITSPADGATVSGTVIITGTASDESGISKVEVSTDGGITWIIATGTTEWSYTWNTLTVPNGNYNIKSRATDNSPNQNEEDPSVGITVTVNNIDTTPPFANAGSDKTVDVGESVLFNGGASWDNVGIVSYFWDFGDGATGSGISPTHIYSTAGTYTVTLTVRDAAGYSASDTLTVTVVSVGPDTTPPTAEAGSDKTVNVGESVSFDGSASSDNVGIESYEWNFGDGTTGAGKLTTHTYTATGTYTVTLTVKDAVGLSGTDTLTVIVKVSISETIITSETTPGIYEKTIKTSDSSTRSEITVISKGESIKTVVSANEYLDYVPEGMDALSAVSDKPVGIYVTITPDSTLKNTLDENNGSVILKMYYTDDLIREKDLKENTLAIWKYDSETNNWIKLTTGNPSWVIDAGLNTAENYAWAEVTKLSSFALLAQPAPTPTPYRGLGQGAKESLIDIKDGTAKPTAPRIAKVVPEIDIPGARDGYAAITVDVQTTKPTSVKDLGVQVFKYLIITPRSEDRNKSGTIYFQVEESEIANATLDKEDIALYRFHNDNWTELPTEIVTGAQTGYVKYKADTPGFSWFAIAKKGAALPPVVTPTPTETVTPTVTVTPTETITPIETITPTETVTPPKKTPWGLIIGIIVVLIIIGAVLYIYRDKLLKKEEKKE